MVAFHKNFRVSAGYDGLGLNQEQVQGFIDNQVAFIPLGRVGTPDEIAKKASLDA
jgi:hypothetical protein